MRTWRAAHCPPDRGHIDEHELHRHFLEKLRALERAGETITVKRLFDHWPRKLTTFARYLEMLPRQVVPVDHQDAIQFAGHAIDAAIDCLDPDVSLVERLELERVVRIFARFDSDFAMLESYALETSSFVAIIHIRRN